MSRETDANSSTSDNDGVAKMQVAFDKTIKEFERKIEDMINKKMDMKLKVIETLNENLKEQKSASVGKEKELRSNFAKAVNNYGNTMDFREILREAENEEKLEHREKEQRAKNLIIHGMLERGDTNGAIKENDTNLVNNILDRIGITFLRLGKKTDSKPRNLKIVMKTTKEVESIMSNLMRLKGTQEEFGRISITEDYTQNEREEIKSTSPRLGKKTEEDPNNIHTR